MEAVELSEKDIETLREAVDGCGGPSYTQALAILDRLTPPAPEVDEATVWTEKLYKALYYGHARTVIAELIASKDAEIARLCESLRAEYIKTDDLARDLECTRIREKNAGKNADVWRKAYNGAITRAEKAEAEAASKDAEIEQWKEQEWVAFEHQQKAEAEAAVLRAENERLKGEPSEEMYEAGYDALRKAGDGVDVFRAGICLGHVGDVYRAMINKAAERNTAEPAKETTVSYDPNDNCPSCGVALGMLHEPDCALMLSCTAEPENKTVFVTGLQTDSSKHLSPTAEPATDTTPEVVVTQTARDIASGIMKERGLKRSNGYAYTIALQAAAEAEARGRRGALDEALKQFDTPTDAATYARAKILRMMTGGK